VPHRVDARRNREVILRIADEAFKEASDVVALEEIARRAGLGRATVYRHFPDRRALAEAVAGLHLAAFKRLVERQGRQVSFRELLLSVLTMQAQRRPLVRLFRGLPERLQRRYTEALIAVFRPAFNQAQREGILRPGLEIADLALVFEMVEGALDGGPAPRERGVQVERLVQALVDGLFRS
jgi:AcrR family transcriptional regulator